MSKRILILDDDADFNHLLTDIFSQASYEVCSEQEPRQALERFQAEPFDLIVTDQKMPGLTGQQFIQEVRRDNPLTPIIMVSGYLDNETIRDLIREGVNGVFLKPLNVFSLLKRTSALLEDRERQAAAEAPAAEEGEIERVDLAGGIPFEFRTFPCRAEAGADFATRLYALRNFKTSLVLIGCEGAPFEEVCADLQGFEHECDDAFIFIDAAALSEEVVVDSLMQAEADGAERATLVIMGLLPVDERKREVILKIARGEAPFSTLQQTPRMVFCVSRDVDTLYDEGAIDDELYLLVGTSEARIPTLAEMPEDIPLIAQTLLASEAERAGIQPPPKLSKSGREYVRTCGWPGDYEQLKELIRRVLVTAHGQALGREDLENALQLGEMASGKRAVNNLGEELARLRRDYVHAVVTLCGEDIEEAGEVMGVEPELVSHVMKAIG